MGTLNEGQASRVGKSSRVWVVFDVDPEFVSSPSPEFPLMGERWGNRMNEIDKSTHARFASRRRPWTGRRPKRSFLVF